MWLSNAIEAQRNAYPDPKLSASARLFLWKLKNQSTAGIFPENVYRLNTDNTPVVSGMLQVFPGYEGAGLKELGVQIGTRAGTIWTAQIPINRVVELSKLNGIKFLEMDQASAPALDSARRRTRVDSIHKGLNLPHAFSGKGVVVGVVDAGFDYTHPTFFDTTYSRY